MNTRTSSGVMLSWGGLRAALMVSTALTACAFLATPARAANWTGTIADWFDPSNWDSGVPSASDGANVSNGGTAQVRSPDAVFDSITIGQSFGQSGAVTVDGADTTWTASSTVYTGFFGDGTIDISGGAVVTSGDAIFALGGTATGDGSIDGAGSVWNANNFTVANDGGSTFHITNGGVLHSSNGTVGFDSGSVGLATVDGAGSKWTVDYSMSVGNGGDGTLEIGNGGAVASRDGYVGANTGSTGTVTVDGEGSKWTNTGTLMIGNYGEGTLDITDGGVVSSADVDIGYYHSGIGTITVDGGGSKLTGTDSLYVGNNGTGILNITGGGAVSNGNTYAGFSGGGSGTIMVDGVGSTFTNGGNLYLGYAGTGSLTISNGASVSLNGLAAAMTNGSVATINIGAAAGETAVAAGALHVRTIEFGIGTGNLVFNHTDADYELASDISGPGVIRQIGSGSTVLSGNSADFAGTTSVEHGGLFVNGSLGGSMSVGAARLGGSGSVGNVTLGNRSVIAPGPNGVGTLSVLGDLTFNAGSTYEVEVNPASAANDLIHVTGTAYLNNASVEHVGLNGTYPWYASRTILTADAGIDGVFGSVSSNMAFLTPDLSYDANNVRMTLLRNDIDFTEVTTSSNQQGVAGAANTLGIGNPIYDQIVTMTEAEAQAAFDALSGEAYGSTDSAAVSSVQQIRDVLQNRIQSFSGGAQVSSLGNGLAAGDSPLGALPAVWGQVFGSWGLNNATANFAQIDRRSTGFLGGADKPVGEVSRIGVALGYSRSDFDVSARSSSGDSDNFHVAGYANTKFGVLDLSGTVGYSYGRAEAKRVVIVGGLTNNLSADYDTHTFQSSVEAATNLDLRSVVLTPFAGLAATYVSTDDFTETGGPAALTVAGEGNTTGTSSLGLRIRHDAGHVALTGSAAWRHAFGDVDPASRVAFASAPAASFLVRGAPISEDALAVGAQINLALTDWTNLSFGYTGEFASDARDQGLRSELRVEF